MDQNRWKIITGIFHAALEVSADERREFLVRAAAGDRSVREEVECLLRADAEAGDYIESPLLESGEFRSLLQQPSLRLQPGDILCGRFRILQQVGEGGMGQIFEAFDAELAVHVALKTIRPEIAASPDALARFRQEVRLARRITHPNVCRTFDLERDTRTVDAPAGITAGIIFLTMEYLAGESLRTRIKREGALALPVALEIARQVASGLEAARALGVVHRDIKPGNIMLVPNGPGLRAVITDFGLAHVSSVEAARSLSGMSDEALPQGTLAYMAPEQLECRPVSPATDTYAFGLLLFEMITGAPAFPESTLLTGIAPRLSGDYPLSSAALPGIPPAWALAISTCLRLKPEDRPRLADVAAALEKGHSLNAPPQLRAQSSRASRWRRAPARLWLTALAIPVVVALFWLGFRIASKRTNAEVTPGALVYLAPVRNRTGAAKLDHVTALIRAGLSQSVQINLLDQSRVGDTLQRMTRHPDTVMDESTAREIAMRNGAVRVVFVTVIRSNGSYGMDVDVQQPDSTPSRYRKHWERTFEWKGSVIEGKDATIPADLVSAARDASGWVRSEVGEAKNDVARLDSPPENVTTGNWEALAEYEQAMRLEAGGQHDRAVDVLRNAVSLDTHFSMAYARLGDILVSIGRSREGFDAYARSLNTDALNRLTRRERDRIKGIYASDTEDFETAEDAFRDYSTYYENDYLGWFYRGFPLRMLARDDESLYVFRRALAAAPDSLASKANLIDQLIVVGNFDEARDRTARLKDEGQQVEASWRQGDIAFLSGDYRGAEESYRTLANSADRKLRVTSLRMLARFAAERENPNQAIHLLRSGIDDDLAHGDDAARASNLLDIAYVQTRSGKLPAALESIESALSIDNSPKSFLTASAVLGQAYEKAPPGGRGSIRRALVDLQRRFSGPDYGAISQLARLRLRGEVLLADGKFDEAISEFLKADALEAPAGEREYLGRAYVAAAIAGPRIRSAERMGRACDAYANIATRPRFAWIEALHYPPGFLGDQLSSYLHTAISNQRREAGVAEALATLFRIRPKESRDDPDLVRAAAILNRVLPNPPPSKEIDHE